MPKEQLELNRVALHTPEAVNQRIRRQIEQSILYHGHNPDAIDHRLDELQQEWDIERMLEISASGLALLGAVCGLIGRKSWLLLPMVVLSFFLQHAIQGWCPPVSLLRRLGVRTKDEILRERYALRALRGDFVGLDISRDTPPQQRAAQIIAAFNEQLERELAAAA